MNRISMKLKRIQVHKYYDLSRKESGLQINPDRLSDGINLIYGQNGTGKTTLARAISALIWPQKEKHSQSLVDGVWEIGDRSWIVNVYGGNHTIKSEIPDDTKPEMPPIEWEDRYYLSLHELLVVEDKDLLKVIKNEINGGIDVDEAKRKLKFDERLASHKYREVTNLKKADQDVKKITAEHRSLLEEEKSLEPLLKQKAALEETKLNIDKLKNSIKYRKAMIEKENIERKLKEYDPVLEILSFDDEKKIVEIEEKIKILQEKLSVEEQVKNSMIIEFTTICPQADRMALQGDIDKELYTLGENLKILFDLNNKIRELELESTEWKNREEAFRKRIDPEISLESLLKFDIAGMDDLDERQKLIASYFSEQNMCGLISDLEVKLLDHSTSDILLSEQTIVNMIAWLGKPDRLIHTFLLLAFIFSLIVSFSQQIYNTLMDSDLNNILQTVSLTIATLGTLYFCMKYLKSMKRKSEIERQLGVDFPFLFKRESLTDELNKQITLKQKNVFLKEVTTFVSLRKEFHQSHLKKLEERIEKFDLDHLSKYPLKVENDNLALTVLIEKIRKWRECHVNTEAALSKLHAVKLQFKSVLDSYNEFYRHYYPKPAENYPQAVALEKDLISKVNLRKEYGYKIKECEFKTGHHLKELNETKEKQINFYRMNSCLPDELISPSEADLIEARRKLSALFTKKEEYNSLKSAYASVAGQPEEFDGKLDLTTDLKDLEKELERAGSVDTDLQNIIEKITRTKTRIQSAKSRHDLADALRAKAEAVEDLQNLYDTIIRSCMGSKLVAYLIENSTRHASKVLKRARELFGLITRHRYEILISHDHDSHFLAKDCTSGHILQLNQLSSGTRIQLLLSVRVAFIEVQEGFRPRLPLLLDEVLGNSDDERTQAIIEAVASLAKEGRQIFYFTAQSDEVERWMAFLKNAGNIPYKQPIVIPSGDFEFDPIASNKASIESAIPPPKGLTSDEYGKLLKIPPLESKSIDNVHLWYFIKDQEILYTLLKLGYTYRGQMTTFIKLHGKEALVNLVQAKDPLFIEKADALALTLEKGFELVKKGRGIKIDEVVLAGSGCISESYLQQMINLCNETGGNPKELIRRLEDKAIQRYRKDKIDELKDYFVSNNFIDNDDPLSKEEIFRELDAFVAKHNFLGENLLNYNLLQELKMQLKSNCS